MSSVRRNHDTLHGSVKRKAYTTGLPIEYVPDSYSVDTGTDADGTLASLQTLDDDDAIEVTEVSGVPGYNVLIDYADVVVTPTRLDMYVYYSGNPAHVVNVQIYDQVGADWETLGTLSSAAAFSYETFDILNGAKYIDSNNAVQTRIYHATTGTPGHDLFVDYCALRKLAPGAGTGVTDHGALTGLSDDDHTDYHTDARGDARYLYRENVGAFTPDADYEPATKKYVDDNASGHNIFDEVAAQTLTAGSTITATDGTPYRLIDSGSAITLTSEPHIAAGRDGQLVILKNVGSYNIIVQDVNGLGGCLFRLTANSLTIQPGGSLALIYDSTVGFWIEQWILNPQTFTPTFDSFTDNISGSQEVGSTTLPAHTFNMTYTGSPSACSIDISAGGDPAAQWPISVPSPYLTLTSGTTPPSDTWNRNNTVLGTRVFTATATVAGTGGLQKTITITFYNRRYAGPSTQTATLTTAQVLGLDGAGGTSGLSNSKTGSFGVTIGASEYLWYAFRATLGGSLYLAISSEIAGFDEKQTALSHTNDQSHTEDFRTWRSTLANLGAITAVISTSKPANRRYCGPSTQTATLTTAQVLGLDGAGGDSDLTESKSGSFSVTIGASEYIWFAYKASLGGSIFLAIDTEVADFTEKQTTLSHTNDYGYTEDFRTWRSTTANVGAVTAVTSTSEPNNRFYMGPAANGTDVITNAQILALDDTADGESGVYSSQARTWTDIQIESGEYLWYVHPDRVTDLATIKDGTTGFAIAGSYRDDVTHTNQYGYAETYRCWRSDNPNIYPTGENVDVT